MGEQLARLRELRNQADYIDKYPGLSGITIIALNLSQEVIDIAVASSVRTSTDDQT